MHFPISDYVSGMLGGPPFEKEGLEAAEFVRWEAKVVYHSVHLYISRYTKHSVGLLRLCSRMETHPGDPPGNCKHDQESRILC